MKKVLLLFTILFVSVITTACINNLAIQELNNKATAYMDKGETEIAICRLKSSLDLDGEIFQTHYNLAVAYNTIGDYEKALLEARKVQELKPDFVDVHYAVAIAKEAIAYSYIENEDGTKAKLSLDDIVKFNETAQEAIDNYNNYLVKQVDAAETDSINAKITELNKKIKDFTRIYDLETAENDKKISKEITNKTKEVTAE